MSDVLLLGAGLVSSPIVRYFLDSTDRHVTVASLYLEDAQKLVAGHERGTPLAIDVSDDSQLAPLVADAKVVVSLVPYSLHPRVARFCLAHKTPLVTASYVSPEIREMDRDAKDAGVLLLNEMGFDPGLDHMSAMQLIESVRDNGGTIVGFQSCAGGIPSTGSRSNPWNYKFSWSPRGVLMAGLETARYLRNGEVVEQRSPEHFAKPFAYTVENLGRFEMYPNRDSVKYIETYQLQGVRDMLRGTIRYPGWCETMHALIRLGWISMEELDWSGKTTYADWCASKLPPGIGSLEERTARRLGVGPDSPVVRRFAWAGFFDDEAIPAGRSTSLDHFADRMHSRMSYGPNDRDMVILRHEIHAEWPDRPASRMVSLLVAHGRPGGESAMARLVSLPAAVGADLILKGRISVSGVQVPTRPEVYLPVLAQLEEMGISFDDSEGPAA